MWKKIVVFFMYVLLMGQTANVMGTTAYVETAGNVTGDNLDISAHSAILLEAETGKVLYEKDADLEVSPASITKIMTLILIFDQIKSGKLDYEDLVTTSEHAKSMGGSQVFLETGEQQSVDTLIKCIIIASGNDACVAMAEHIAGSEEEFVKKMNERAAGLGMTHTVFRDCCGLYDTMEHHTSARDVGIMSRELINKYPEIFQYSSVWMENITHTTDKGSKEFTLANTNKLLKQYSYATGLKTGSTSLAKYCVSATAEKDGVKLIAVIMGAKDYKARFAEAKTLLEYGYNMISIYEDTELKKEKIPVKGGTRAYVYGETRENFKYICGKDQNSADIIKKKHIPKSLRAPLKKGDSIGSYDYYIGNEKIGDAKIYATNGVNKKGYMDYYINFWYNFFNQ